MIHTVHVDPSTTLLALKKEFRKKLMTGGAVLRIAEGLSADEQEQILSTFIDAAEPNNIAELVLRAFAEAEDTSTPVLERLRRLENISVKRALDKRRSVNSAPPL